MFGSSLASGGKFATSVIGAVAKGDISSVGSITGEQASEALTSYLGYSSAAASEIQTDDPVTIPTAPAPMNGEDVVTLDGGSAAGVIPPETQPWAAPSAPNPVASSPVGAKPVSEGSTSTGVITTATHTASTTPRPHLPALSARGLVFPVRLPHSAMSKLAEAASQDTKLLLMVSLNGSSLCIALSSIWLLPAPTIP